MSATGRNLPGREVNPLGAYDTPIGVCRSVIDRLAEADVLDPGTRIVEPSVGSGNWIRALDELGRPDLEITALDLDPLAPGLELARERGHQAVTPDDANRDPGLVAAARMELSRIGVPVYRQDVAAAGFLVTRLPSADLVLGNPPYSVTAPPIACPECNATGQIDGARGPRRCPACNRWPAGKRPRGLPEGWQPEQRIQVADLHVRRALQVARHVVYVLRLPFLGGQDRHRDLWTSRNLRQVWTVVGRPSFAHGGTDNVESAVFWWDREWDAPWFRGAWLEWERAA